MHVLIEYGLGILTILSPFLFSFDDDAGQIVAVLIGAGILVLAVVTDAPTGLARTLPDRLARGDRLRARPAS